MTSLAVRFALITGLGMFSVAAQAATATAPGSQNIRSSNAAFQVAQGVIPTPGRPEGEPRYKKKKNATAVIATPGRPEGEPRYKKKK